MDREKLWREVKGWTLTILAVLVFRTFLYEAVYIPSGSMIPTLEIGDYVIVEKWAYGARLPFTATAQATWATPRRGDIVVLLPPTGDGNGDDLIKRVVAVGGDVVEIRNGHLVVNNRPAPVSAVPGDCRYQDRVPGGGWREDRCRSFEEELEGHRYRVYCNPEGTCGSNCAVLPSMLEWCVDEGPRRVPEGYVFLAGDHRDHSSDSRFFGPVPVGRIKGRAWMALASWGPGGPRWGRLFHRVNH